MSNHNPKAENLTNAGKGRPALGLKRTELNLPAETRDRLDELATQLGLHRNQAADLLLRSAMGLPIDGLKYDVSQLCKKEIPSRPKGTPCSFLL